MRKYYTNKRRKKRKKERTKEKKSLETNQNKVDGSTRRESVIAPENSEIAGTVFVRAPASRQWHMAAVAAVPARVLLNWFQKAN